MKSFFLSTIITAIIFIFYMYVLEPKTNSILYKIPNWFFITMVILSFAGYVLAMYWGVTGIFKSQHLLNLIGIGLSLFGLGIYVFIYVLNGEKSIEKVGQFDNDFNKIETNQRYALFNLLQQTNTKEADVKFVNYWSMDNCNSNFELCVQDGNIIAIQIKNKELVDVGNISKFYRLSWLVLENCNIESIAGLNLPALERLTIDHNQLTSLAGLENNPNIAWLNFQDNPITDSSALLKHPVKELNISYKKNFIAMSDTFYRLFFFGIIYTIEFGCIYFYGRKAFPKFAPILTIITWLFLMLITYYTAAVGGLFSIFLMITEVFILKKRNGSKLLQQFYTANKIYASKQTPQAALDVLGKHKNWMFAEGTLSKNDGVSTDYLFWQGYTSSSVSTGTYSHTTVFTNYIAFIFPPGTASEAFKQIAKAAADKSKRTFKEKLKFFFVPDYNTPILVTTAADGSFIIEYTSLVDVEYYSKRLDWIKENYSKLYFPSAQLLSLN